MNNKEVAHTFPGFAAGLNTKAVRKTLEAFLKKANRNITLESCEIADVGYDPERNCSILYRTKLRDNYFIKRWEHLFLGKVLKVGESPEIYPKEALYSQKLGIVFIPFPYDPAMPWLPEAFNETAMMKKLSLIISQEWKIKDISIALLAYMPQMRATFLYTISAIEKRTGELKKFEWVGKTNVFKTPQRVFANYWALWKEADGRIPMPRPTGFLLDPQLTFQEKIDGIRLGAIVNDCQIDQIMEKVANSLACLHQLPIPLTHKRTLEQECKNLNRWSGILMNVRPDLKMRMAELKNQILAQMEARFSIDTPIHADFHHTNILVDRDRVQFIDMDEMAYGDPCVDIGRFLSSLRIPSLRTFGSFEGLRPQRELFVETYLKQAKRSKKKIRLFESAALFTSAASTFRLQRSDWENEVHLLLDESERVFQEAKESSSVHFSAGSSFLISEDQRLKWLREGEYLKAILAPYFYEKYGLTLLSCQYFKEGIKKGYRSYGYRIKTFKNGKKFRNKIEVFIHKKREGRSSYEFQDLIIRKMALNTGQNFILEPIAHMPKFCAFAFYSDSGRSLIAALESPQSIEAADKLALSYHALHQVDIDPGMIKQKKTDLGCCEELLKSIQEKKKDVPDKLSYVIKDIGIRDLKYSGGSWKISCPIRKNIAHPFTDIGSIYSTIILYGIKQGKLRECGLFLEAFCKSYAMAAQAEGKDLNLFIAEALCAQACKPANHKAAKTLIELAKSFIPNR